LKWANTRAHSFVRNWLEIRKDLLFKKGENVSEKAEGDGEAHLTGNLFDISFQNIKIIQKQVKYFLTFKDR